jgi:hypothetical protein
LINYLENLKKLVVLYQKDNLTVVGEQGAELFIPNQLAKLHNQLEAQEMVVQLQLILISIQ